MNCPRDNTELKMIDETMTKQVFVCPECSMKITCEEQMKEYKYRQCFGCIHTAEKEPSPCSSCEQAQPSNYEEK